MLQLLVLKDSPQYADIVIPLFYQEWIALYNENGYNGLEQVKNLYMKLPGLTTYIYLMNNEFVGSYSFLYQNQKLYLCDVYIRPSHRKQGVGSLLVEDAKLRLKNTKKASLYLTSFENTVDFYKSHGFIVVNRKENKSGQIVFTMLFETAQQPKHEYSQYTLWGIIIIGILVALLVGEFIFKVL